MIHFSRHTLGNGLTVVVNRNQSTPMAVVNILYDAGSRDESEDKTGLAHLFEHLMFEGSGNIPGFDQALHKAGGESNAFTNNDITNYYLNLPSINIETAFWLESDRMYNLDLSPGKLEVQKNVVAEEFRQVYLNQPYGDAHKLLRELCYQVHPYKWSTIGKGIDHVLGFSYEDAIGFYQRFYHPANAILSVCSPAHEDDVISLAEKWFGDIPGSVKGVRSLPLEPEQHETRRKTVSREVPASQLYIAFHCCPRNHPDFYSTDLLSDLLSNGESSRLKQALIKEQKICSEVSAFISGSFDTGMFVISCKLHEGVPIDDAEAAVWDQLDALKAEEVHSDELQKVKNKVEASHIFSTSNLMARTMNLAYYELLGDAGLINQQVDGYAACTPAHVQAVAARMFRHEKASVLHYLSAKEQIKS